MTPWLNLLGIGDDGLDSLTKPARSLFDQAKHLILPERVHARLTKHELEGKTVTLWRSNIHETVRKLQEKRGDPVTILATGDPFHFGIAASLMRTLSREEMIVIPHPSGFSLAASRMGWALQHVDCLSLHGRSLMHLHPFIEPDNRLLALTSNGDTPKEAAKILVERGFEKSEITVLEHMGGPQERSVTMRAEQMLDAPFADFNMLAISCKTGERPLIRPRLAGLENDAFLHDGQLTKREVRAATLAALRPYPDALLWDVGAGCGSVAIEWMRAARGTKAIAFEHHAERLAMLAQNALTLGVPTLEIVKGRAPETLSDHKTPDAVFIGGGLTVAGVFEAAWLRLRSAGALVANTVTLEGEKRLIDLQNEHGGTLTRLDVASLTPVGRMRGLQPRMSVLQWQVTKP